MRPDRGIVKKAIEDAKGNLSGAAILLGCSRPTIYSWIYQLGLEKVAGIRIDNSSEVYNRGRKDTPPNKTESRVLSQGTAGRPILRAVSSAMAPPEIPIQATMRLPEPLWKRVKIESIKQGCHVSEFVRRALESALEGVEQAPRRRGATKGGDE